MDLKQNDRLNVITYQGKPISATVALVLYNDDDRELHAPNGIYRDATRWSELAVVVTQKGAFLIGATFCTRWQGELGRSYWHGPFTADECKAVLVGALREDGGPEGVTPYLAELALRACNWWDDVATEV